MRGMWGVLVLDDHHVSELPQLFNNTSEKQFAFLSTYTKTQMYFQIQRNAPLPRRRKAITSTSRSFLTLGRPTPAPSWGTWLRDPIIIIIIIITGTVTGNLAHRSTAQRTGARSSFTHSEAHRLSVTRTSLQQANRSAGCGTSFFWMWNRSNVGSKSSPKVTLFVPIHWSPVDPLSALNVARYVDIYWLKLKCWGQRI